MTGTPPPAPRLTARQALGWGIVMALVVALLVLYFLYGRNVRPLLGLS